MPRFQRPQPVTPCRGASRGRCCCGVLLALLLMLEEGVAATVVPINGRQQHMVFTAAQVQAIATAAYDKRLRELTRQGKLDRNPALVERVRRIAGRIITQAIVLKPEAAQWAWEIHTTGGDRTDAYCMAGGKILVGDTFLEDERFTDDELAALLGHEIAHTIAEHVREQLSAVPDLSPAYAHFGVDDVIAVLGWDLSVTLKLAPLSRLHELEADDIGIYMAAKAGYDPQALLEFYRKLGHLDRGNDFFNSHGANDQRVQAVESLATYAEPLYKASLAAHREPGFVFH
jgi:predicted Zn-dependent protease